MNDYQRRAIDNHCRLASETVHPRFMSTRGNFAVNLTVNSGYE